jgi:protein-tyrosine phosphatase
MSTDKSPFPIRVLFVCLGNICRSPLAEGIFSKKIKDAGLHHHFLLDSCGTSGHHDGENPDARMIKTAASHGIDISKLVSRKITPADLKTFDYILAMDRSNQRNIEKVGTPTGTLSLMRNFQKNAESPDVPDPWFGAIDGFEEVYQLLDECCNGLLDDLKDTHRL